MKRGHDGLPDPSVVDKLWSVTPFVNACECALVHLEDKVRSLRMVSGWFHWTTITPQRPYGSPRTLCMALLATTWGMRLTWNFWRKGGYIPGSEDYRWVEVRKWMPGMQFEVFNVVFICLFQPLLLMALAAPAAVAAAHSDVPLNQSDVAAAVLFSMLLCGETVADLQMFDYQTEKCVSRSVVGHAHGHSPVFYFQVSPQGKQRTAWTVLSGIYRNWSLGMVSTPQLSMRGSHLVRLLPLFCRSRRGSRELDTSRASAAGASLCESWSIAGRDRDALEQEVP